MRLMISTGLALALAFGVGECAPLAAPHAAAAVAPAGHVITGQLRVVGGETDLGALDVRINGAPARIAADGSIAGIAAEADHIQLTIRGPDIFDAVFTFAPSELAGADGRWMLPAVEAVARAPGRVELFFGGDVMMGRRFEEPIWNERVLIHPESRAADMARLLEPMKPYFAGADLASVNLETVLATHDLGDSPGKSVVFYTHSDAAKVLADAGIDFVTLGNNHVYDFVEPGLASTLAALDAAKLPWSGAGRNEAEAAQAARLDAGGHSWSMLGFVGWKGKVEPNQVAEGGKGGAAFGSDEAIEAAVRREVEAGRSPIVQYHGSSEYSDRPTEISERRMRLAIDSGATLVVSHHPHVSHGLELYKGHLIAYSLGNFVFDQYFPETQATYALKLWMDGDRLFRAEMIPIQILDYRPVPAMGGVRQAALRRIIDLSAARGTTINLTGGHGVIMPSAQSVAARPCRSAVGAGIIAYRYSLVNSAKCRAPAKRPSGRDLLMRGDFEGARYNDALDRSWEVQGGTMSFITEEHGDRHAMLAPLLPGAPVTLTPKSFFRPAGTRLYSLMGRIRTETSVHLEALVQEQPKGSSRIKALETAPLRSFGTTRIAGGDWQSFRFDIDIGAEDERLPLRPLLRIGPDGHAAFDDLAFIAWADKATESQPGPGYSYDEEPVGRPKD